MFRKAQCLPIEPALSAMIETKYFNYQRENQTAEGAPPKDMNFIQTTINVLSGKWMSSGNNTENIRNQVITEQQTISLVAALFCTISIPTMFLCDDWDDTWEKGVFGLLMNLASTGLVASVLSSVIYLLALNECSDEDLPHFLTIVGSFANFPMASFSFGSYLFGGVSLGFWCYRTFPWYWFLTYAIVCNIGAAVILLPTVGKYISSLYRAKNGKYGGLVMSRAEVEKSMTNFISIRKSDGLLELTSYHEYKTFLLDESQCSRICEMTQRRVKRVYEDSMRLAMKGEYEAEAEHE